MHRPIEVVPRVIDYLKNITLLKNPWIFVWYWLFKDCFFVFPPKKLSTSTEKKVVYYLKKKRKNQPSKDCYNEVVVPKLNPTISLAFGSHEIPAIGDKTLAPTRTSYYQYVSLSREKRIPVTFYRARVSI